MLTNFTDLLQQHCQQLHYISLPEQTELKSKTKHYRPIQDRTKLILKIKQWMTDQNKANNHKIS